MLAFSFHWTLEALLDLPLREVEAWIRQAEQIHAPPKKGGNHGGR